MKQDDKLFYTEVRKRICAAQVLVICIMVGVFVSCVAVVAFGIYAAVVLLPTL